MEERRGAEAVVHETDGKVVKERVKKGYRIKHLDQKIRRRRTRKEARIMKKARRAVNVPRVISVGKFVLEMEKIPGRQVKEMGKGVEDVAEEMGRQVGRLHEAGIAHNDLTTSNMIIQEDGALFLIDFGLAEYGKVESFATDLKVLKDCLQATHGVDVWKQVVEGYQSSMPKAKWKPVLDRLKAAEKRGRYQTR